MRDRKTHCGTLDYNPPEMLSKKLTGSEVRYDFGVDVWSVGVFAYELNSGRAPFEAKNEKVTHSLIWDVNFIFPRSFSSELKDFLSLILLKDPSKRMPLVKMLEHPWIKRYEPVN